MAGWLLGTAALALPALGTLGARERGSEWLAWAASSEVADALPPAGRVSAAVRINGVPRDETVVLRGEQGDWCFTADDLKAWGIRSSGLSTQQHQGQIHYCLGTAPGYRAAFQVETLTLDVSLAPEAFEGTALRAYREPELVLPQIGYGGFLNYDFLASRTDPPNASAEPWLLGMLGEAVFYTPRGSLQSSFVGRDLTDSQPGTLDEGRDFARLETFWRMDFPDRMTTLTLGDALGSSGYWGRPTRFAGIRYATNFETRPGFVTRPQLAFTGEAAVPSVVDVFVNDSRVQSLSVPGGPFEIADLPSFANVGEARIVVTDLLGRQSEILLPFITSQRQLRAGLSSFALEAGVARETIGLGGNEYGDAQAVAQYRHGITDRLTAEGRAEWSDDLRAAGLGASLRVDPLGILSPVLVFSDSDAGSGALASLTLERPSVKGIYAAGSVQWAEREFRQLGLAEGLAPARLQLAANAGKRLANRWNVNLGYVEQSFYDDRSDLSVISASLGTVWQGWGFNATLADRRADEDSLALLLSLNRSFDAGIRGSASLRLREGDTSDSADLRTQLQKSLPEGPGYGWRVVAGLDRQTDDATALTPADTRRNERFELSAGLRTDYATFTGEIGRANDINAVRLGMNGALGAVERVPFVSRNITRSFAMVQEPELAGLPVIVNGQRMAVLDENGYALLPRLQPFAPNQVRIDLDQVPLDVYIDQPTQRVVTGQRSGHRVAFNARRLRMARFRLQLPDGRPVPLGAEIEVLGLEERFIVAEQGESYIAVPSPRASLRVRWNGSRCTLDLDLPAPGERPAELGVRTCEVQP
jgi:outer membrane usher protein